MLCYFIHCYIYSSLYTEQNIHSLQYGLQLVCHSFFFFLTRIPGNDLDYFLRLKLVKWFGLN